MHESVRGGRRSRRLRSANDHRQGWRRGGNTGWALLIGERSPVGAIFDLSHGEVEVVRCFLSITPASERRLWEQASAYPTMPTVRLAKPETPPWLATGLLPDGMALLANDLELMFELGDFERCVAWALLSS